MPKLWNVQTCWTLKQTFCVPASSEAGAVESFYNAHRFLQRDLEDLLGKDLELLSVVQVEENNEGEVPVPANDNNDQEQPGGV